MSRTNYTCKYNDERHRRLREIARRYRMKHPDIVRRANKNSRERHKEKHKQWCRQYSKDHPLAAVHGSMMKRCGHRAGKTSSERRYYEGRGIEVCKEWRSFPAFEKWAMANGYKKGLQLDRIKPDKGYSPENCRFVTAHENAVNRKSSIKVKWNGELIEFARLYDMLKPSVFYATAYDRLHKGGWSVKDALLKPLNKRRNQK